MTEYNLYMNKDNFYFLVSQNAVYCDSCKAQIYRFFYFVRSWRRRNSSDFKIICHKCADKIENDSEVIEVTYGLITDHKEAEFMPLFIQPPVLNDCRSIGVSTFQAVELPSEKVKDHTIIAGRESLEGAQIGKDPEIVSSEKDHPLELDEAEDLLLKISSSKIITPGDKLLEDKSTKGER